MDYGDNHRSTWCRVLHESTLLPDHDLRCVHTKTGICCVLRRGSRKANHFVRISMDPFTPKSCFEKRFAGNAAGPVSIDLRLITKRESRVCLFGEQSLPYNRVLGTQVFGFFIVLGSDYQKPAAGTVAFSRCSVNPLFCGKRCVSRCGNRAFLV